MRVITKLLMLSAFVGFLYSVFQAAICFHDKLYTSWILFLTGSILSYQSYRIFINSLDEENNQDF